MNATMWLMVLVTATACGSTASGSSSETSDDATADALADIADLADVTDPAELPDGWECDPKTFDSMTEACICGTSYLYPVCVAGKIACPPCQDAESGDVAPDSADTTDTDAAMADSAPDVATAPYSAVQAVFDARCITCHNATALGLPGYAALPLTSDVSHKNLVNQPAHETCGNLLVAPGKPMESYLWQKLTAATPCEGGHMPAKYEMLPAPPLTTEQLAAIQDWIACGALP